MVATPRFFKPPALPGDEFVLRHPLAVRGA